MSEILVLGGLSGIGLAITNNLKDTYKVETLSRRLEGSAGIPHHSLDATSPEALRRHFERAPAYDHLVICAADTPTGPLDLLPDEQAKHAITNKLWLAYTAARDIPWSISLTLFSGFLSARPGPASALQSGLNAAIEGLARGIARERAPARVNCVSPGTIDGGLWDRTANSVKIEAMKKASERSLLGRPGTAEEIALAVRFCIECRYLTGETVSVDGGARIGPN